MSDAHYVSLVLRREARRTIADRRGNDMSKITRIAVLAISLTSVFGVLSSAAGAVTWTNVADTAFTATAGASTLTVGATAALVCTAAHASGTSPMSTVATIAPVASGTMTFTGCRLLGTVNATMDCGYTFTAASLALGVTNGSVDITCGVYQSGLKACHIGDRTPGTYTNPAGATAGLLTLSHSNTLTITNGAGTCPIGNGVTATLMPLTFRVTSGTGGPTLVRDA
jgi:hypothetical protein